jgi:ubiquinone/menaquinone biosynthesis C-methylase UbiE
MIKKIYYWLYRATSMPDERGEIFGGRIQGLVRRTAMELCAPAEGKILEIGCGSGLFILKLAAARKDLEIWGVDRNLKILEETRRKAAERNIANVNLAIEDARRMSFGDETFDRVICVNFFVGTSFEEMAEILRELKRVCKRSGRIIFEFRSSRNALFALKYALARFYDATVSYPLHTFDPAAVDRMVGDIGLRITEKRFIGFPLKRYAPIVFVEAVKS